MDIQVPRHAPITVSVSLPSLATVAKNLSPLYQILSIFRALIREGMEMLESDLPFH